MRVAFLGLGIMGSRMASNLARKGFELTVWNRTEARARELAQEHPSVRVAGSPAQAAAEAQVVFSMVVDGPQVEALLLGEREGAAGGAAPGTVFVDCSTIGIDHARSIGEQLARRELRFLDAPVTGSSPRAQDGTLVFMVGGAEDDLERARPALATMGTTIVHAGPLGQGQAVKLINNAVAAVNATTLGQAVLLAERLGIDLDALFAVLRDGAGGSTMVNLKAEPMRRREYETLFKLDHMLKDVRLCLDAARESGAEFSFADQTEGVLAAGSALGHGDADFAALIEALEQASQAGTSSP